MKWKKNRLNIQWEYLYSNVAIVYNIMNLLKIMLKEILMNWQFSLNVLSGKGSLTNYIERKLLKI